MRLIPFSPDFAQYIFAWLGNPAYKRFFRGMKALSLDEIKTYPQTLGVTVLMILVENQVVGMVQLADERGFARIARVGVLIDESVQKRGLALEATKQSLDYLFNTLDFRKAHFYVCQDDLRVTELMVKGGLRKEATLKGTAFVNGVYLDEVLYTFFKDHFNQIYKR